MKLVKCEQQYWEFVRLLRNDKRVQTGFINYSNITPDQQISYMRKHSENYRIVLVNGTPAGYVGVIDDDIRVCTHPDFQKKGVGKFMINNSLQIWPNAFAKIKINNYESLKLFESCGFKKEYYILTNDK